MKRVTLCLSIALLSCGSTPAGVEAGLEQSRYLRFTSQGARTECTFTVERNESGRMIRSVTERGKTVMTVAARYDAEDRLLDAETKLNTGGSVKARVADGKAVVRRVGQEAQEFDVPKGVIVTSAPDWTDTFSLCRLYDSVRGGRQEFEGLWIHPTKPSFRLTFSAENTGETTIRHGGKSVRLLRLTLRLRNNSRYAAWVDVKGRMIKLISLPFKEKSFQMMLSGFEQSAAGLKPE